MSGDNSLQAQAAQAVAVFGLGLIGGSITAALKKRGFSGCVLGVGRRADRLEQARAAGLIDEWHTEAAEAAARCDLLVFCTPVDRIVPGVRAAAVHCRPGTLITDAGSVKESICRPLADGLPEGVAFLGSHPLAGSEKQGFEHADADLFEGRVCVVTPPEGEEEGAACPSGFSSSPLARLRSFWRSLGMTVVEMSPADHDRVLARTSHLPHIVAAALAALLKDEERPLAATGFRDTTRIAAGAPDLWQAILLQNARGVVECLDAYGAKLADFRSAIAAGDAAALRALLQAAKEKRESLP